MLSQHLSRATQDLRSGGEDRVSESLKESLGDTLPPPPHLPLSRDKCEGSALRTFLWPLSGPLNTLPPGCGLEGSSPLQAEGPQEVEDSMWTPPIVPSFQEGAFPISRSKSTFRMNLKTPLHPKHSGLSDP